LRLVEAFADGEQLLEVADRHNLEGRRRRIARRPSQDWRKIKTAGWRAANLERWRLFEKG